MRWVERYKKEGNAQIEPNKVLIFNLNTRTLIDCYNIYNFNLNQYKSTYDDFYNSLEKAILKRYPENSIPLISK